MNTDPIPSIEELRSCTQAQLEEAALTLVLTIKAASIYEPQLDMVEEKLLLSSIRSVLSEKSFGGSL